MSNEKSFCEGCMLSSQFSVYWIFKQYVLRSVLSRSDITNLINVEASFASVVLSKHEKKFLDWKNHPLYLNNNFQNSA